MYLQNILELYNSNVFNVININLTNIIMWIYMEKWNKLRFCMVVFLITNQMYFVFLVIVETFCFLSRIYNKFECCFKRWLISNIVMYTKHLQLDSFDFNTTYMY